MNRLLPRAVRPGDRVVLVSPAGPARPDRVRRGRELLESWGLRVEIAAHVRRSTGYLSGSDEQRLVDLNAALRDPGVRAVFCTRGGYGSQRIVDGLDLDAVRADPKVVVGFSDITALHLALWRRAGLATFYGPGLAWDDARLDAASAASLRGAITGTGETLISRDPEESTATIRLGSRWAEGLLLGGNLSMLAASIGTPDTPHLAGCLLLLEDVGEAPYRVDRMLTQLLRAGVLAGITGVALGQFVDCTGPPGEPNVVDVLRERLAPLSVPVVGGLPIGHGPGQLTVPLGVPARLDPGARTLRLLGPSVLASGRPGGYAGDMRRRPRQLFLDRTDAGRRLAERVGRLRLVDPLVLALPRGGVPVAFEVAQALGAPLDVLVVRKIGAPSQPELGVGAIAEGSEPVFDDRLLRHVGLDRETVGPFLAAERVELGRRVARYRGERPLPDVRGRSVVLVDDGLATGGTATAALRALRARGAGRLVLAVPVAAVPSAQRLGDEADDVVVVSAPASLMGVGEWYGDFTQTSDEEVLRLLAQARGGGL